MKMRHFTGPYRAYVLIFLALLITAEIIWSWKKDRRAYDLKETLSNLVIFAGFQLSKYIFAGYQLTVLALFAGLSGMHAVELLEDTTVVSINFCDLQELYDKYHEIERLGRLIAIQTIVALQQKIDSIQSLTARQRYRDFIKPYPTLLQRVSLGYIASYLGMNQVTLSRIRKNAK